MKILGLDISTRSTGWSLIEDDKLLEYGKIVPSGSMSNAAKLHLFSIEISKILNKYNPDFIAIEDVVQVSSVSITKILARFNGVAILESYKYNQKDPQLYEPSKWKKLLGLSGGAKKCEIQIQICRLYNLLSKDKIDHFNKLINSNKELKNDNIVESKRKEILDLKKKLKKEKDKDIVQEINKNIIFISKEIKQLTIDLKKNINNVFDKLSQDIYIETGINEDIADASGVAVVYKNELKEINEINL